MSRGHFIGLNHHRLMLQDALRMDSYQRAIEARVRPGMRVMDLGTGTGILAMWAAKAGAEVVAVEPHAVIEVAKKIARDNELADRIQFVRGDAKAIALDQPVDLVITECMGNFFVTDEMQPVLRDLPRHMRPGAETLPRRITLHLAAATLPLWKEIKFWEDEIGGFDFSSAIDFARQAAYVIHCEPELVATDHAEVADFPLVQAPDAFVLEATLTVKKKVTLHALVGWFDADLADGVTLSTRPGQRTHWGQMAFALPATSVGPGDRVEVRLELAMDASLRSYFRWSGRILTNAAAGGEVPFEADTRRRFGDAIDGDAPPTQGE
ncbi:MAG: methyltransferase domain-containing protein [Deltaproteobacteria bacterium]|nr:methyltransferase domain-containing protein [Deltaproteobacteria bacterium]